MAVRWGLVFVWASAVMAMVLLYIQWPVAVYLMGLADWVWEVLVEMGLISQSWIDFHDTWVPRFRSVIGYMALVSFISLLIYIIVNSARKEPDIDILY